MPTQLNKPSSSEQLTTSDSNAEPAFGKLTRIVVGVGMFVLAFAIAYAIVIYIIVNIFNAGR